MILALDSKRVDVSLACVLHPKYGYEAVARIHDWQDRPQNLEILEMAHDQAAIGVPPLEPIEVVAKQPGPAAATNARQRRPHVVRDIRRVVAAGLLGDQADDGSRRDLI